LKEVEKEFKNLYTSNQHTVYERDSITTELEREKEENYTMKMTIDKEERF